MEKRTKLILSAVTGVILGVVFQSFFILTRSLAPIVAIFVAIIAPSLGVVIHRKDLKSFFADPERLSAVICSISIIATELAYGAPSIHLLWLIRDRSIFP